MGILTYLVYPLKSITKNRMRSLFAVIGILLAISFVSGSFIAIDSSTSSLVKSALDNIPVDFTGQYNGYQSNLTIVQNTITALKGVEDIVDASTVIRSDGWYASKPNSSDPFDEYYHWGWGSIGFLLPNSTRLLQSYGVNGTMPEQGTVAISNYTAEDLGIGVGDEINVSARFSVMDYIVNIVNGTYVNGTYVNYDVYINLTFEVSQIWSEDPHGTDQGGSSVSVAGLYDAVILDYRDAGWIMKMTTDIQNVTNRPYTNQEYYVWIDRDKVVTAGDIAGSIVRLDRISERLGFAGNMRGITYFHSEISSMLWSLDAQMSSYKLMFFALSMPVMLLGTYLSVVGIDLATSERRREIGILKARGGTKRQVLGEMVVESLLLGALAGLLGLLGGILMSRTLIDVLPSAMGAPVGTVDLGEFSVTEGTLVAAMVLGILLMLASSRRPIKRLVATEIAEALHFFSPAEARKDYRPTMDIAALALSALCVFSVIAMSQGWFDYGSGSFIIQIVFILVIFAGIVVTPLLPLLLTVSVTRLLTRGPRRIYTRLARIIKPWTKNVHYLVEKNIERNPKRSSLMCMIIALAVGFGLFVSVTMESTLEYQMSQVRYQVGADINAMAYTVSPEETYIHELDGVGTIEGVESVCRYYSLQSTLGSWPYSYYGSGISVMNTTDYAKVVHPADFWFVDSNARKLEELKVNETALIDDYYAGYTGLRVGNTLQVTVSFQRANLSTLEVDLALEIIGVVNGLPGIQGGSLYIDRSTLGYISEELMANSSEASVGLLIDLADGANHTAIAAQVEDAMMAAGLSMSQLSDLAEMLDMVRRSPAYGSLTQFFNAEYAFSMAIMTVGVMLIVFITVSERRQEIACIMARGASSSQMGKILMGESMTLMTIGLVIGTSVGLFTAYLFNEMTSTMSHQIGHSLVLTIVSVSILVIAIISMLLASFLTTVRAGKIRLAEMLRIRGG